MLRETVYVNKTVHRGSACIPTARELDGAQAWFIETG